MAACTVNFVEKKEYVAVYYDDSTKKTKLEGHLKWDDIMKYKENDVVRASLVDGFLRLLRQSEISKNTY